MNIYDELYQTLKAGIDHATEVLMGIAEAFGVALKTAEEAYEELQKMLNSVIYPDSQKGGNERITAPKRRQRHCRKVVINYNYIPVMARNLPYQRRAF